jgi:hypothetical protein
VFDVEYSRATHMQLQPEARSLAKQTKDRALAGYFAPIAADMTANEAKIVGELNGAQGGTVDIGGYYHPCEKKTATAMRPSATLNAIVANAGRGRPPGLPNKYTASAKEALEAAFEGLGGVPLLPPHLPTLHTGSPQGRLRGRRGDARSTGRVLQLLTNLHEDLTQEVRSRAPAHSPHTIVPRVSEHEF